MDSFSVDEIAIGFNMSQNSYNGMECEIREPLDTRRIGSIYGIPCKIFSIPCYLVQWANGAESAVPPENLRKRPPKEDARKWFDENIKIKPKEVMEA